MRFTSLLILLLIAACSTPTRVLQDVQPLTAPDNMMYVIDEGRSVFLPVPSVLEENDVLLNADTTSVIATKADVNAVEAGSFYNNDGTFTGTRIATIPSGDTFVIADQVRYRFTLVEGGETYIGNGTDNGNYELQLNVSQTYTGGDIIIEGGYLETSGGVGFASFPSWFLYQSGNNLRFDDPSNNNRILLNDNGSLELKDTNAVSKFTLDPDGNVIWGASWNSQALTDLTFFPVGSGDFLITRGDATTTRFEVDPDGVVTLHDTTGTIILTGRADGEVIVGANFDNGNYDFQVSFATSYFGDSVTMADLLQVSGEGIFGGTTDNGAYDLQVNGDAFVTGELYVNQFTDQGVYDIQIGNSFYLGNGIHYAGGWFSYPLGGDLRFDADALSDRFVIRDWDGDVRFIMDSDNGIYMYDSTGLIAMSVTEAGNVEVENTLTINPGSSDLDFIPNGTAIEVQPAGEVGTELIFQQSGGNDRIRIDWDDEVGIFGTDGTTGLTVNAAGEALFGSTTDNGAYDLQVDNGIYQAGGDLYFAGSGVVLEGSGTQSITAGGGITHNGPYYEIQGSGGAVDITAVPQIAAGSDGEILVLRGLSDTNTVQIDDGNGVITAGAASFVMGLDDVLVLIYGGGEWVEISRSDN